MNEQTYNVVEKFVSINGEGTKAGELAVFIRFKGCNLQCSYCDTKWANQPETESQEMTVQQLVDYVLETGVDNVTLTGGEPLLQQGLHKLIQALVQADKNVEIETNGSMAVKKIRAELTGQMEADRLSMTMDYKLAGSGMERFMELENFKELCLQDTVKFVAGSRADLEKAEQIIRQYELTKKCHVYISPVFGAIEPAEIVEYMKEHLMNGVRVQLQLHKFIWNPEERGV